MIRFAPVVLREMVKISLMKFIVMVGAGLVTAGCWVGAVDEERGARLSGVGLEERVRGYWASFAAGELRSAFGYMMPDLVTYEEFVTREKPAGGGELVGWKFVRGQEVEEGKAEVELRLIYRMPFSEKPLEVPARELWGRWQGTWYRMLPERVVDPFSVSANGG